MPDGVMRARHVPAAGQWPRLRLFVFTRHAESVANADGVVSSNPARPVALTERGRAQARALGAQISNLPIDRAVSSRLLRARETISIALGGRPVPVLIEPGFDEVQTGDLDGQPIQAYWQWLGQHAASDRLPHGESLNEALRRYAGALRRLLAGPGRVTLVVTHEFALRHIAAAAAPGSWSWPETGVANAVPYLFNDDAVLRAAAGLAAIEDPPGSNHPGKVKPAHPAASQA